MKIYLMGGLGNNIFQVLATLDSRNKPVYSSFLQRSNFITRFLGQDDEINLNTKHQEFIEWKWVKPVELPEIIVEFKKSLYIKLLNEIHIYNLFIIFYRMFVFLA